MVATASAAVSYFQGGDHVELLSAQGKAPASTWKIQGKIIKSFDKTIKGNAFQMDGSSETKMQLPKTMSSTSSSLGLTQRFLVFQVLVPHTRSFSVEIGFSDFQKIRRRLVFASAFRETTTTTLHVQIPIDSNVPRDQWMNFVFDLQALTERFFPASSYRSMESICISGSCRLKRIFTMKDAPFCQSVHDNLVAQLLQFKHQRVQSKDPGSVPSAVASFSDMKEIPKHFVFSAALSCLPIPTEYFIVSSERDGHASALSAIPNAAPGSSTRAVGVVRTGTVVKIVTSSTAATKPKSAAIDGNRVRTEMDGKAGIERTTADVARVRSAPSSRAPAPQQPEMVTRSGRVQNAARSPDSSPTTETSSHSFKSRSREALGSPRQPDRPSSSRLHLVPSARISYAADEKEDEVMPSSLDVGMPSGRATESKQSRTQTDHTRDKVDAIATRKRKEHRQNVISEIQSKLDQLTKEAEEEEERDRNAFLKHTSIPSQSHSPGSDFDDCKEHHPEYQTPLPFSQSNKSKGALVESAIDRWGDTELLRSPEPMILRRAHAAKKPEMAFSSSIFSFDRSGPKLQGAQDNMGTSSAKKLFDWDSLLEDSAGSTSASQKSASSSSMGLDSEPAPVRVQAKVRVSGEETANSSNTELLKSGEIPRKSPGNDRTSSNRSAESIDDVALSAMLEAKRQARHQRTTPSSEEDSEHALPFESMWERHSFEHPQIRTPQHVDGREDEDLHQSSFDFSTSSAKPGHEYPNSPSLDDRPSRESSPRAGSEASLDFTDDVRELERVDEFPDSCDVEDNDEDERHESRADDDDDDDDDSFDFDELVVCDQDTSSQSNKLRHSEKRVCLPPTDPDTRIPKDAASTSPRVDSKDPTRSQERVPMEGKKERTREFSMAKAIPAATTSSPPRKPSTIPRDPSEASFRPSSSRVVSSSSRRLASLLESTDWSQLPLSSRVASPVRAPHTKVVKPTTTQSQDKTHTPTRSSKPNGATSSSLELIYDPILRCYYDPVGKKYYTLAK